MNISTVKNALVRAGSIAVFKTKKASPHILLGVGVVGLVGTTVVASNKTLKLSDITDEHKSYKDLTDEVYSDGKFTKSEYAKELTHLYWTTSKHIFRLYSPAIALGTLSIAAILTSHGIMQGRNLALVSAYNALDNFHQKYREEVKKDLGVDKERDIFERANVQEKRDSSSDDADENSISDIGEWSGSPYAKFFDESSPYFKKDADYNKMFLLAQQRYANDILISRGHIFLNEVYDMLGLPHTRAGALCGWLYEAGTGDDCVDFGIFDGDTEIARGFVNGFSKAVLLDFNVDGEIWNKLR